MEQSTILLLDDITGQTEKIALCKTNQLDDTLMAPRTENSQENKLLSKTNQHSSKDITHPIVIVKPVSGVSGDEEVKTKESDKRTPLNAHSNISDPVRKSSINLLEKQSSITSNSISISSSTSVEFSRETSRSSSKQGDEVWAECNEELSKLVQEISGKAESDQEVGEADSSLNITIPGPAGGNYSDIDDHGDRTSTPDTRERERIIKKTKFLKVDVRNQKISKYESFDSFMDTVEDKNSIEEPEKDSSSSMRLKLKTVKYDNDSSEQLSSKNESKSNESNGKCKLVDTILRVDETPTIVKITDEDKLSNNTIVFKSSTSSIQQSNCGNVKCNSDLRDTKIPAIDFENNLSNGKNKPLDSEYGLKGTGTTKTNESNIDKNKTENTEDIIKSTLLSTKKSDDEYSKGNSDSEDQATEFQKKDKTANGNEVLSDEKEKVLNAILDEDSSSTESNVSNEYDHSSITLNTPEKERIINKTKSLQVVVTKQKIPDTESDDSDNEAPSAGQENVTTKSKESIVDAKQTSTKEKHIPSDPLIHLKRNGKAVNNRNLFGEEDSPEDSTKKGLFSKGNDSKQEAIDAKSVSDRNDLISKPESFVDTKEKSNKIQEIPSKSSSSTKRTCGTFKYNSDSSDEENSNERATRKNPKKYWVDKKLDKSMIKSDENTIIKKTECSVKNNCDSSEEKEHTKKLEQANKTDVILEMVHDEPQTIRDGNNITSKTECNPDPLEGDIPSSWMEAIVKNNKRCFVRIKNEHYKVESCQESAEQIEEGEQGCDDRLTHGENNGKDSGEEITGKSGKRRSVLQNKVSKSEESDIGEKNFKNRKEVKGKGQKYRKRYNEAEPMPRKRGIVKYDSDSSDGEELARKTLKRLQASKSDSSSSLKKTKIKIQKHDNDDTEDQISPRRKRGIVKYNCDSSDEEEHKKELAKSPPRKKQASRSDSSSTVGESDTWTSKVFSNNYNDCCQVGVQWLGSSKSCLSGDMC